MAGTRQTGSKTKIKNTMTDAAIKARTGKDWGDWFAALDKAGAAGLDHRGIAKLAREEMGAGDWYGQMVAVSYERARGIRAMNQKCDGEFSVSVTRVMEVSAVQALRRRDPGAAILVSQKGLRGNLPYQGQILAGQMEVGKA